MAVPGTFNFGRYYLHNVIITAINCGMTGRVGVDALDLVYNDLL